MTTRRTALTLVAGMLSLFAAGCTATGAGLTAVRYDRASIQHLVANEAVRMRVPVALALAVAHAESNFDPRAQSRKGARGVMQIMPAVARDEYAIPPSRLWEPRLNVRLGLHFLRRLLVRYDGRVELALSYYNGGSAVGDLPRARVIPATAPYVAKVLRLESLYRARLRGGSA